MVQAKAIYEETRRFSWNTIHPFGMYSLKASTDKAKKPTVTRHQEWPFQRINLLSLYKKNFDIN